MLFPFRVEHSEPNTGPMPTTYSRNCGGGPVTCYQYSVAQHFLLDTFYTHRPSGSWAQKFGDNTVKRRYLQRCECFKRGVNVLSAVRLLE